MNIISHRANLNGSEPINENKILQIRKCIKLGLDVEIDVRLVDNQLYLGHDEIQEKISKDFLYAIKDYCWIHCKNLEALSYFNKLNKLYNYFWHENDSHTLTSKGYIWTYPGKPLVENSIYVMPELIIPINDLKKINKNKLAGVCTDYPLSLI
tara:strand:+ start:1894 stop:2352 length:459 start_codon:yes stop_codon:yes gene_type:complete